MKFRLKAGLHVGPDYSQEPRVVKDRDDNETEVYPDRTYEPGDLIDSGDVYLAAKFGANKFELIDGTKSKKAKKGQVTERSAVVEKVNPHGQVEQGHQATMGGIPGAISEEELDELGHEHSQPTDGSEVLGNVGLRATTDVSADDEESEEDDGEDSSSKKAKSSKKSEGSEEDKPLKDRYALDKMSKSELLELADQEGVDLGKAETKEQILQKLRHA